MKCLSNIDNFSDSISNFKDYNHNVYSNVNNKTFNLPNANFTVQNSVKYWRICRKKGKPLWKGKSTTFCWLDNSNIKWPLRHSQLEQVNL